MLIKLIGSGTELDSLHTLVTKALTELALDDAVRVETTENPALAIEEESIDFRDMIFQGELPAYDEIKSMFISILGDDDDHEGGCGSCSTGGCGTCGDEESGEGSSCGTSSCS